MQRIIASLIGTETIHYVWEQEREHGRVIRTDPSGIKIVGHAGSLADARNVVGCSTKGRLPLTWY